METGISLCLLFAGITTGPVSRLTNGYFLEMISESQFYVLNPGQSVVLECNFHADHYSLFEHPVLWRKEQLEDDVQVNILSNINAPFFATNRFEVNYVSAEPRYQLELSITDVVREDSGNYTCEVRGSHSAVLAQVMHYLFVRAPVESVSLSTDSVPVFGARSPSTLRLTEGRPSPLRCLCSGGFPPPTLTVFIDRRDVTTDFSVATSARLSPSPSSSSGGGGGTKGLRLISHRVERWTGGFVPRASDDGMTVKCVAAVQGLDARIETAKLDVEYSPKISCSSRNASPGEPNVALKCVVRANPRATAPFWVLPQNGTRLATGEVVDDFWAASKDLANGVTEAVLHMRRAGPDKFRTYTIVAENTVAISRRDVELTQVFKPSGKRPLADDALSSSHSSERVASRDTGPRGPKTTKNSAPHVQMPNGAATWRMRQERLNNCIISSTAFLLPCILLLVRLFQTPSYAIVGLDPVPRNYR